MIGLKEGGFRVEVRGGGFREKTDERFLGFSWPIRPPGLASVHLMRCKRPARLQLHRPGSLAALMPDWCPIKIKLDGCLE